MSDIYLQRESEDDKQESKEKEQMKELIIIAFFRISETSSGFLSSSCTLSSPHSRCHFCQRQTQSVRSASRNSETRRRCQIQARSGSHSICFFLVLSRVIVDERSSSVVLRIRKQKDAHGAHWTGILRGRGFTARSSAIIKRNLIGLLPINRHSVGFWPLYFFFSLRNNRHVRLRFRFVISKTRNKQFD